MEYKEDLRIQKTRRDLRNSIINLLKKKPIEKITVIEICNEAMVNRITFYKYYEDKYQLLNDTFYEIKDTIVSQLPSKNKFNSITEASNYWAKLTTVVLTYIDDNIDLFQAIKKNSNNDNITKIISNITEESFTELFSQLSKIHKIEFPINFASAFLSGGFYAIINYWLDHTSTISKNDVIKLLNNSKDKIIN